MSADEELGKRIEAVLFLENRGLVEIKSLAKKCNAASEAVEAAVEALNARYAASGSVLEVLRLENAYKLSLRPDFQDEVLTGYRSEAKKKISRALLETLVIVAYKQPVTRAEIDAIRGVQCGPYLKTLLDEEFIRIAGKKEAPGKPTLFKTTAKFLVHFGLKSLSDLPAMKDIRTYDFLEDRAENKETAEKSG
ncbi:MAG: SMC-Scp complex subunit ScpB [Spirochaetia bacterium]|nr:SMC-Scp complex subunit ScpB [Spirochaetia bacterium]